MSVFERSEEMQAAFDRGEIVRDLNGGTPAMKEAGTRYLPKLPKEDALDYAARIGGGTLFDGYEQTRDYFAGQVFSKPIKFDDAAKGKFDYEKIRQDADLRGNDLRTWAKDFFTAGVDEGMSAVFVDFPNVKTRQSQGRLEYWDEELEQWLPKTDAVDIAKGWRPFLIMIRQNQILGGRFEYIEGKKVCVMLRYLEQYTEDLGQWDTEDVLDDQVRVLYPGRWEVWRKKKDQKGIETEYLHSEGGLGPKAKPFDFIPVKFFSPGKNLGMGTGEIGYIPAMEGLAYLNKDHWCATCDHRALEKRLRNPVIFGKMLGHNEQGEIEVGLSRMVHSNDPGGDLRYVGVLATEVARSEAGLAEIESRMAARGLMLLTPGQTTSTKTAFQAQRETSESTSTLKDWALDLQNCLDESLKFAAMWTGAEADAEPWVTVNTEFMAAMAIDYQLLSLSLQEYFLSRESAFGELKRRGQISEHLQWEDEKERIQDDQRLGVGPTGALTGLADMFPAGGPGTPAPEGGDQ